LLVGSLRAHLVDVGLAHRNLFALRGYLHLHVGSDCFAASNAREDDTRLLQTLELRRDRVRTCSYSTKRETPVCARPCILRLASFIGERDLRSGKDRAGLIFDDSVDTAGGSPALRSCRVRRLPGKDTDKDRGQKHNRGCRAYRRLPIQKAKTGGRPRYKRRGVGG